MFQPLGPNLLPGRLSDPTHNVSNLSFNDRTSRYYNDSNMLVSTTAFNLATAGMSKSASQNALFNINPALDETGSIKSHPGLSCSQTAANGQFHQSPHSFKCHPHTSSMLAVNTAPGPALSEPGGTRHYESSEPGGTRYYDSGLQHPVSIKEFEAKYNELKRENFNLKLRIYLLEKERVRDPDRVRTTEPEKVRSTASIETEKFRFTEPEKFRYMEPEKVRYMEPEKVRWLEPERTKEPEKERRTRERFVASPVSETASEPENEITREPDNETNHFHRADIKAQSFNPKMISTQTSPVHQPLTYAEVSGLEMADKDYDTLKAQLDAARKKKLKMERAISKHVKEVDKLLQKATTQLARDK